MVTEKICYSEVCNLYHLKKGFIVLKSNTNFKESCVAEKWRKLSKSLKAQKYQPKSYKKISMFQVGNKMWLCTLTFLIGVNLDCVYGLEVNQEICSKILLYFEYVSLLR